MNGTTTIYVTDADNREVLAYDGTTGEVRRWYAWGAGIDELLGQMNVAADTRTTPLPDIQGSVIATLDSGSGALAKAGFLPFGGSAAATGTFRYTGRRIDPETGLYYYRARMYHPAWGRFLQPDPIGTAGGINLYAYVGNDALNFVDPSGLAADRAAAALGSGMAAINSAAPGVSDYVHSSFAGLARIPGDVQEMAEVLRSSPLEFLRRTGPGLAGIGVGVPFARASVIVTRGGNGPVQIGRIGEELAGISGPKVRIPSATGTAKFRVPDQLTSTTLREVKYVQRLRIGGRAGDQLRDYAAEATRTGRQCVLCIRQGTQISPRSQQFLDNLGITVEKTLP